MGCSPSKGKLFSKPEGPGPQKVLLVEERQDGPQKAPLAEAPQDGDDSRPEEEKGQYLEADEKENDELPLPIEELTTKETSWCQLASDTTGAQNAEDVEETEVNVMPQEVVHEVVQTDTIKKVEKRKKNKGKRRSNEKQRRPSIVKTKLDFAPHMVRAHQAAYAFLNPNISKYEALLGLLDQAAQTQLSLKPTMSAFVLRFEEINQAVEEMAEEGEFMLKEHGDYMALHSGMMGTDFMPTKPRTDTANPPNPPPDLLKQLLQHSTEKMRLVGGSAQALGDTTLMEAVEYFSSVSERLVEKLQAKQAAEHRLALVLARVEQAAMRKSNPEDSALHSEDSGIGGENESLTGSERSRRHRESAGSGSCGSGSNICDDTLPSNLLNLVGYHKDDEEDEEEGDDDHEEYEDDEGDGPEMKRSNSSPPDPSQPCLVMSVNYMQDQQPTVKRPLTAVTATKSEYSSSTDIMMELQKIQKNLDQRMKKMAEIRGKKELAGPHYNLYRAGLRRHSASGSADAQKGLFRTSQSPGPLPRLAPQPPKHQSVRGLINTFSQGVDGRPGQSLANIPPHIRRPRKSQLSDRVNGNEGGLVINGNNNNNRWPEGRDDLDEDNLPPPPPEVMMDDSFQSTEDIPGNKEGSREDLVLPIINQKAGVSQRLKASVQNVEVLPNRANMVPRSISFLPVRQDAVMGTQEENDLDPEMERVKSLYQKARKMIHLCNTGESHDKRDSTELNGRVPSPLQARMGQRCGSTEFYEGEMSSYSLPVTAPPVSRVRLPPSCPSVCHRYPHPPAYRSQSASRPSSRPSSPRTVTRATDNNDEEIIPSVSFRDARSVFCRKDSETCSSSGSSVLPKLWGEASRGRLPTRGIDDSTRRTQSEQRPCLTSHSEFSKDGCSATTQGNGE